MKSLYSLPYACLACLIAVSVALPVKATEKYPALTNELANGRSIWLANCETCHAYGTAGAPNPLKPTEWEERVEKPQATLYEHAIQGFYGESDTYMPPRGGNPELSDEDVMSAVDYMVALANFYLQKNQE